MTVSSVELEAQAPKLRRRPRLTGRDRQILTLLGQYGCVGADRIKSRFWKSTPNSRTHYRRIGILKRRGLIATVNGDGITANGYRLTKRGLDVLRNINQSGPVIANRRAYKTQFAHDQMLIDIRSILETSPLVRDFAPESEVRRKLQKDHSKLLHWENAKHIPDAMFVLAIPGKEMRMAIELELTPKAAPRYTKIFRNHLLAKDWDLVIYIAQGDKFKDQLMERLNEVKSKDVQVKIAKQLNGIYFCTLDEFLSKQLETPLTNGKKEISLGNIARNFGLSS